MGLLTPWFLLGLLAIAGPLAAHLRRRTVRNRVAFSAVAFLEAQPPRSAKRRWEDLLLLVLRSLALALLALAFARPFFVPRTPPEPSSKPAQLTVLLLDTSASMHRGSLWQDARQRASALAANLPPDAELELRTFDLSVRTRLPSEQWRQTPPSARPALLQSVLESLQPSWAAARLDLALTEAARAHASLPARSHTQLVLLSDFQQGSSLAGLHGFSWPPRFHVQPFPLTPPPNPPPALLWQPPDPESSPPDAPTKIHVLAPAGLSADSLPLTLEGAPQRELRVPVLPGKSRLASLPLGNLSKARIRVAQSTDFASEIWVASLPQRPALVALNPSTPQAAQAPSSPPSSGYFLANALRALGDSRVLAATADQIAPERDPSIRLWALAGAPPPALLPRIRASLEQGATGLLLLESPEDAPSLSQLAGIPFRCERRNAEGFALLGSLERTHPLFAPFASASFSDFTSIRFFQFQALSAPDPSPHKILARFDSGEPALLEIPCGKGRLFVWTSSWIPAHSQWALSSRCVPFLSACLDLAEGGPPSWIVGAPGESLSLPAGTTGLRDGSGTLLEAPSSRITLAEPGVYTLEPGGGTAVLNIARDERLSGTLPPGTLEALGVPCAPSPATNTPNGTSPSPNPLSETLALRELEDQQAGWRYVLAGVLGLLLLETLLARRSAPLPGGSP